ELFTLATLGLDPRNTFFVFIVETLLFGLLGTFIGFVGSYILTLIMPPLTTIPTASSTGWSVFTIFVALFTGVVMVFFGGYIPSVRAQGLSLMGRVKVRELVGEIISEGDNRLFILPIREVIQNSELLYDYLRELLSKMPSSLIDHHSIKSEIRGDGSFNISFVTLGSGQRVFIPCELRGERDKDIIVLSIVFPKAYGEYEAMRRILRDLEAQVIGFSTWRDMQLKMKIVREAPKKQKTIDETIDEIRGVIEQIKDSIKKIRILDAQKGKLTEEVYSEFRQKYLTILDEKFKILRSMTVGLEPYSSQIQDEIKKTNLEIERITIAYNLGEISEEEYIKICSPLQNKIAMLRSKLKEIEEIFEFLKKPVGII
ncbi:MAG: FtsX-like permease family protein, partial [Candidatus Bathyarchaeia archaeon]